MVEAIFADRASKPSWLRRGLVGALTRILVARDAVLNDRGLTQTETIELLASVRTMRLTLVRLADERGIDAEHMFLV
jgi:hypothetical protein